MSSGTAQHHSGLNFHTLLVGKGGSMQVGTNPLETQHLIMLEM